MLSHPFLINKHPILVFLFALLVRAGLFAFNELYLDLDPYWDWQIRVSTILVLSDFGSLPVGDAFEVLNKVTLAEALQGWASIDRGLVYVHLALKELFGTTSYIHLQGLQIVIDALIVFPLMSIAYTLSKCKTTTYLIGILYAVFLPQVWLAIQPGYNVWLTTGYVLATWIYLKMTTEPSSGYSWRSLTPYALILLLVFIITNQIRSTIILLPIGMAAWWWATIMLTTSSFAFPRRFWRSGVSLLGVGVLVIGFSGALNQISRGESSPVRSTFGHAFWTGVGQFENPYGVLSDDGSVGELYERESGIELIDGTTGDVEYNMWLTRRAVQFIFEYPTLYASMVLRRAIGIIFPNMPFTIVADKPAYDNTYLEIVRTQNRIDLQQQYGKISPTTIRALLIEDPFYVVGFFWRLIMMIFLPLGCTLFFIFSEQRALGLLAIVPLVYQIITLSPVVTTPIILIPAYAAILPVVGIGWILAIKKFGNFYVNKVKMYTTPII